jgi:hypothetical protein
MTRSVLSDLRTIRNVTQAIEFLGLSVAEFAALMPSQWATHKHVSAQLVCDWKSGHRKPGETQRNRIAQLLANKMTARYGREVGVRIIVKSPWKVTAWVWCEKCRKRHEWKRYVQRCTRRA